MTTSRSLDEEFLLRKKRAYQRHHLDGILKFTPKDFKELNPSWKEIMMEEDYRYKGYPGNYMLSPREPIRHGIDDGLPGYRKMHHFEAGKPVLDEGHHGVRYGENVPLDSGTPKPIPGMLYPEKSSAEHRKMRKYQLEAEDDIQKFKMEKQNKPVNQSEGKTRDLDMRRNYDPWGKPGGGAPKEFHDSFGKPGGGAPLRTNSGKLKTDIQGDPMIRFHQAENNPPVRQSIGESLRYVSRFDRGKEYAQQLDQQIVERALLDQEKRITELRQEMDMINHDPYGRPGAGAPNLSLSGKVKTQVPMWHRDLYEAKDSLQSLASSRNYDENYFSQQDCDTYRQPYKYVPYDDIPDEGNTKGTRSDESIKGYHPWNKGCGNPVRDRDGKVINSKWSDGRNGIREFPDPAAKGGTLNRFGKGEGAGAPVRTNSGGVKTRLPITMKADERGASPWNSEYSVKEQIPGKRPAEPPPQNIWYPFGTSGGGAPNKDQHGNIITTIYGREAHEIDSANERRKQRRGKEYLDILASERQQQYEKRMEEEQYRRAPVGELARIVKEGQVGKPRRDPYTGALLDQSLPITDVTGDKYGYAPRKKNEALEYHTELDKAAEARKRMHKMDSFKDRQEIQQHHEVFAEFFGRPGGGAPNPVGSRRHNTNDVVYSPRKDHPPWLYGKDLSQYPNTPRESINEQYHVEVPFATH